MTNLTRAIWKHPKLSRLYAAFRVHRAVGTVIRG
jgi:hypothetical protein